MRLNRLIIIGFFLFLAHSSSQAHTNQVDKIRGAKVQSFGQSTGYGQDTQSDCRNDYGDGSCAGAYPGTGNYIWRYIKGIGYRKFSPIGAARKDWQDYKRVWHRKFYRDIYYDRFEKYGR